VGSCLAEWLKGFVRILVLGASGATGREVVRQALAEQWNVTAFVRDPARLAVSGPTLHVVRGDVGDYAAVAAAVGGHDGVISTLGVSRPLHSDPIVVAGIQNALRAMEEHSVSRLVYLSFIGVHESRPAAGFVIRQVAKYPLRHEIADHETKEALIRASGCDWTIVRAPKLTNGQPTDRYRHGEDIVARSLFPVLSRADVAAFLLRQVRENSYVRRAPRLLP
jgi:putative NADH-flavin reductase